MSHLKLMNTRTRFLLIVGALLLTAGTSAFALRGVSADSLSKLGITSHHANRPVELPANLDAVKRAVFDGQR